jgi:hypothetical protein
MIRGTPAGTIQVTPVGGKKRPRKLEEWGGDGSASTGLHENNSLQAYCMMRVAHGGIDAQLPSFVPTCRNLMVATGLCEKAGIGSAVKFSMTLTRPEFMDRMMAVFDGTATYGEQEEEGGQ